MTSSVIQILVLLVFSALYSASETAITSLTQTKLYALKETCPKVARHVEWLTEQRQSVLSTILVANNLVNIAASAVGTALARDLLRSGGVYWAVLAMTVLVVVFGEVIPKSCALANPMSISKVLLPFVHYTSFVLLPFVWLLNGVVKLLSKLTSLDMSLESSLVTREDIENVVKIGQVNGALEESERRMIDGIINFEETRVSEIMVPRTDLDMLNQETSLEDVVAFVDECGRSRIPVYDETPDDIVGILYVKDLLRVLRNENRSHFQLKELMRPPLFVPETMKIQGLFSLMRSKRVHLAVAVDEYGGTAGIVTMEDMLEEIVGDIQDEYDQEKAPIETVGDEEYLVQGSVCLEDFAEWVDYPFESEEVESVGGYVLDQFGNFPSKGDRLELEDWTIEVTELEDHRVNCALFKRKKKDNE